jgi:hypothetical protein
MDEQDKRIEKILGISCERSKQNTITYLQHLRKEIKFPCKLTGVEDFPWEEPYILGGWDKKEYEKLKKDNPSYTDEYELLELLEPTNNDGDIIAKVKRATDRKVFKIGLSWLECVDSKHEDYKLLEDYSVWYVNY